jgi:hypothetical protein
VKRLGERRREEGLDQEETGQPDQVFCLYLQKPFQDFQPQLDLHFENVFIPERGFGLESSRRGEG